MVAMTPLTDWQMRVVVELDQLSDRAAALARFIDHPAFSAVDKAEQRRLIAQSVHMLGYMTVLQERIDAWPK